MPDDVTFPSGDGTCAAWVVRPDGAGEADRRLVVVMAHGFSLTRHDGLLPYAERLAADAGVVSVVFDHRHLGDSSGEPRQRFRDGRQLEDWRSAVAFARRLPGVDPSKVVLWGFSFSGAHAVRTAVADGSVAGLLVLCPFLDGLRRALATPPATTAWIVPRAVADLAGRHTTIPVTAQPGERAAMTMPGECDGFHRAVVHGSPWQNRISPAVFLKVATIRPVRLAPKVRVPTWVGLGERDVSVDAGAVARFASRVADGELHRYPYDHFDPFVGDAPDRVAADQADFLRRHGLAAT